jgi:hypothetical protein
VEDGSGVLFGTTQLGAPDYNDPNNGTVFSLRKRDESRFLKPPFQIVHAFRIETPDRWAPYTGLLEASDGVLYGATSGADQSLDGGAIFKINENGAGYRVLHTFDSGQFPPDELVKGRDGVLTTVRMLIRWRSIAPYGFHSSQIQRLSFAPVLANRDSFAPPFPWSYRSATTCVFVPARLIIQISLAYPRVRQAA